MTMVSVPGRMLGHWAARLFLGGMLGAAAAPTADVLQLHPERTSKNMPGADTRGGQLVAREDVGRWHVLLGNRTVLDGTPLGAVRIRLLTVATGRDADHVVVLVNTNGDCPTRFAVVAGDRSGHAVASPPFGSCADPSALNVDGDALVFTMPGRPGTEAATGSLDFRYAGGAVKEPPPP